MNKDIVVVSDNHGLIEELKIVRNDNPQAYAFIHCGDSMLPNELIDGYAVVKGNNDYFTNYPNYLVIEIDEKHKIFVIHGHNASYQHRKEELALLAKNKGCDICCYGHTHVYDVDYINGVYLINPGALRFNRDYSKAGYAIIHINDEKIEVERKFLE